ncbi:MAG: OmpA family protein [Myxococcales bacterium FL481]|nr:MAG: OmpA family protein [Myxococcales bacterium FL481]
MKIWTSVLLFSFFASGCVGEKLRGRAQGVQTSLQRAIRDGSKSSGCAPKETALAEAHIKFAEDALNMGEYERGREHVLTADTYTKLAIAKTEPVKCRDANEIASVLPGNVGDKDGDGYDDAADKCPEEPEDFDNFEDGDGCPDRDNDGDGVLDADQLIGGKWTTNDRKGELDCRDEAEDKDGFEDEDGCPDLDNDQDGVPDATDKCPDDPEDHDQFEDENGCPDPDNDQDNIPDVRDKCPLQPEDYDGDKDDDGCPDLKAKLDGCKITLGEKVYFKFNKWNIDKRSDELLADVATILKTFPEIRVEIGGHTDSKGSNSYNKKLSQKRVNSVLGRLRTLGIDAGRMSAVGYGESRPVDTNRTSGGRARNRRVEFNRTDGACKNR